MKIYLWNWSDMNVGKEKNKQGMIKDLQVVQFKNI